MDAIIEIGQPAPAFDLPDQQGIHHSLDGYEGKIVILNFWSAECPWSERVDAEIRPHLENWDEQVVYLPIASNANETGGLIRTTASQRGLPVILFDTDQQTADAYGALTTPHFFILDKNKLLQYQGAFDDVTFRQRTPSLSYVKNAVEALLGGGHPDPDQTNPYGCTVVRAHDRAATES